MSKKPKSTFDVDMDSIDRPGRIATPGFGVSTVRRQTILWQIEELLSEADGWARNKRFDRYHAEHTLCCIAQAEILIDLLEILDCGSTGGYGQMNRRGKLIAQDRIMPGKRTLIDRWKWLKAMPMEVEE